MSWSTPRTWVTDEVVTATMMNTHVRDNLNALKAPPTDHYECDEASDYTTTSTTFVDVDATNLALTITTAGGDVMVHFHGMINHGGSYKYVYLDVDVDGTREGGDDGIVAAYNGNDAGHKTPFNFTRLIRAATHSSCSGKSHPLEDIPPQCQLVRELLT